MTSPAKKKSLTFQEDDNNNCKNKTSLRPDFSIVTAASESEFRNSLQSYAGRFQNFCNRNVVPLSPEIARKNALLKYWISRVRLCTIISAVLIGCLLLLDIYTGHVTSTICGVLFIVAITFFSEWGCQKKDWRALIALFIFSFVIVAYASAYFLVNCLQYLSEVALLNTPAIHSNVPYKTTSSSTLFVPVNFSLLFELACVIFWSYTVYAIEKTIRLVLELEECMDPQNSSVNQFTRYSPEQGTTSLTSPTAYKSSKRSDEVVNSGYEGVQPPIERYTCSYPPKLLSDDTECSNMYKNEQKEIC
jgi:hypothetical protein